MDPYYSTCYRSKDTDPTHTCGGIATETAAKYRQEMAVFSADFSSEDTGAIKLQV